MKIERATSKFLFTPELKKKASQSDNPKMMFQVYQTAA